MAEITSALIKELREKTGAGMMDCKKALSENNGDLEAASDWLRKKGLAAAAKKSSRIAAEGLIGVSCKDAEGAILEVNTETDFVGRNEKFQAFVKAVAEISRTLKGDLEATKKASYPGTGRTVEDELTQLVATIGENMSLRRTGYLQVSKGAIVPYIHNVTAPDLGRLGVLVALESEAPEEKLVALGKQIAMHVAAAHPISLNVDAVDPEVVERERTIFRDQALASGKPEEFIEKMVDGRLRKFFEEVVLLEQVFVIDGKSRIKEVIANAEKEWGQPVTLTGFLRFALGEGIEKAEEDFAAEVAAQLGS